MSLSRAFGLKSFIVLSWGMGDKGQDDYKLEPEN